MGGNPYLRTKKGGEREKKKEKKEKRGRKHCIFNEKEGRQPGLKGMRKKFRAADGVTGSKPVTHKRAEPMGKTIKQILYCYVQEWGEERKRVVERRCGRETRCAGDWESVTPRWVGEQSEVEL